MDEAAARGAILLQAFESVQPASPNWSHSDGAWATRLALHDSAPGDIATDARTNDSGIDAEPNDIRTDGDSRTHDTGMGDGKVDARPGSASGRLSARHARDADEAFIAQRVRHALQRLVPRDPAAAHWLARRPWRWRWLGWMVLGALAVGVLADSIGPSQRVNLLAPPLWAVVVWNAIVYALLLGHRLSQLRHRETRVAAPLQPSQASRTSRPAQTPRLLRLLERMRRWMRAFLDGGRDATAAGRSAESSSGAALRAAAALWLPCGAALAGARAAAGLHAAAAALACGLIMGLYARGLVLDYRATWESTFLSASAAHALLRVLLAPAAAVSGIALPDVAAFAALRSAQGADASVGVSAAPWIHLIALTLLLLVVLPRVLLAAWHAGRAHWLTGHLALPLGEAYFQRLIRARTGGVARVVVVPYASPPGPQAVAALHRLLVPPLGDGLHLEFAPTASFGAEDAAAAALAPGTTLAIALFDLTATPEAENQGRFAERLAARAPAGAPTLIVIDEAEFARRFHSDPARLAQRRDAWRAFAEGCGTLPVFADFSLPDAPDPQAAERGVVAALSRPVRMNP